MASGFALRRNGFCLATETECGETVYPYHACCPSGSFCPHQYNVNCCPTAANCTQTLLPDPQCADAEWDLFDNNGYFCCLRGLAGYATPGNTDGCAEAGYRFQDGEQLLRTISTGKGALSTTTLLRRSTTSASLSFFVSTISEIPSFSTAMASETPKIKTIVVESIAAIPRESPSSSASTASADPKTGLIVGGSIGAIATVAILALAAWFLIAWRRRSGRPSVDNPSDEDRHAEANHASAYVGAGALHEMDSRPTILEMPVEIAHEKDSRSILELPVASFPEMPA